MCDLETICQFHTQHQDSKPTHKDESKRIINLPSEDGFIPPESESHGV